jgi:hypothetical protein
VESVTVHREVVYDPDECDRRFLLDFQPWRERLQADSHPEDSGDHAAAPVGAIEHHSDVRDHRFLSNSQPPQERSQEVSADAADAKKAIELDPEEIDRKFLRDFMAWRVLQEED